MKRCLTRGTLLRYLMCMSAVWSPLNAADPVLSLSNALKSATGGQLEVHGEVRARAEDRENLGFGRDGKQFAEFLRSRIGITWKPATWIRVTAMAQDARAPLLGKVAPDSIRDPLDLQEAWVELFGNHKTGLVISAGRQMVSYGDGRLVASPQWGYLARTWDTARAEWRLRNGKIEALFLSPVRTRSHEFNRPLTGERITGIYSAWTKLPGNELTGRIDLDVYALRHDQNRIAGYTGPGRYRTDSFGMRWKGTWNDHFRYQAEGILQTGKIGETPHRAAAWVTQLTWQTRLAHRLLETSGEYKFASGTTRAGRSGSFDQLFPAAHDKLGHEDLIGWRNVRNVKGTVGWTIVPGLVISTMFNDSWLASAADGVYNAAGKLILKAPGTGLGGTQIGRELDAFCTWKLGAITLGAGGGRFFPGEFVRRTTPGLSQNLVYVFQTYSF